MKANIFNIWLLLLFIALGACEKDKFVSPSIQTLSVKAESINRISVIGNIAEVGNEKILDYGFVYGFSPEVNESNGIRVSLGSAPQKGEFSQEIEIGDGVNTRYGNNVWVRAYLKDTKGTAFGALINVSLPMPSANSIYPSSGMSGDIVKIQGKFYNPVLENIAVTFQSVKAKVVAASDTEISVEVPSGIQASHGNDINVQLTVSGVSTSSYGNSYFKILANIKDFHPKSGPVGTVVNFTGDNISNYYSGYVSLQIGDVLLNNISNSFNVPFGVGVTSELTVTVNGRKKKLTDVFTVTPPQVTSVSPEVVFPGQNILIAGNNFPPTAYYSGDRPMVKIGGNGYQNLNYHSNNQFSYTLPISIAEGEHLVTIKVGPHEVQAPKKLRVIGYAATGFSPSVGGPGKEINIAGNFVSGTSYIAKFGTYRVSGNATSATNLRVYVPSGIDVGHVKVSVEFPGKTVAIPGDFEIIGHSLTSFSPASGVPGVVITIKGAGFNPNTGATIVKFGSISVNPMSVTDNTILVTVPSNVAVGAMKLSVVSNGQTVAHEDNFTILN